MFYYIFCLGCLQSLPELLPNYIPPLIDLPFFLLHLGTDIDWESEQTCFESIALQLSKFYMIQPGMYLNQKQNENEKQNHNEINTNDTSSSLTSTSSNSSLNWFISNILFPSVRRTFTPPHTFSNDGTVVQMACLEQLYKIFERC
jgi:DNA mismatch repair protein MLH1